MQHPKGKKMKQLNIERLINDLGGAAAVAEATGVVRTQPYAWIRRGSIRTTILERIKETHPLLDINQYFEEKSE
jgi:hypothetical protein|tara:strand:+ start:310 stop:531 length:222 start_codon:yes stop_codon:yes gene_type:complete